MFERERGLKNFSKAFTLVEILIVVVIIGILSSALLPRLQGCLAKTRDLKRQADLRNIAAAIELYKNEHGEVPVLWNESWPFSGDLIDMNRRYAWSASNLAWALGDYLAFIPVDSNKNINVWNIITTKWNHRQLLERYYYRKWEYLYLASKNSDNAKVASRGILIAKVENPIFANYVLCTENTFLWPSGGKWYRLWMGFPFANHHNSSIPIPSPAYIDADRLKLCASVQESDTPKMQKMADGTVECQYSSADQLYYIVIVE